MDQSNNLETILRAGAALSEASAWGDGVPYVVVPDAYHVESLEAYLPKPARKRSEVTMTDTGSFIAYINKHGSHEHCTVYADVDAEASKFCLTAIIDDHGADINDAHWRDHRCTLEPKQSVAWKRWNAQNKKQFGQADFASYVEDNLADIATVAGSPSGADMLQMAGNFEANAERKLRSKINLQSGGTRFEFVDDDTASTRTTMNAFSRFALGMPVFRNSENAYSLEARLKFRVNSDKLLFWFELIAPDRVFEAAVKDELKLIQVETGFQILYGTP